MKKYLKDITEKEVRDICEIYDESYVSFIAGEWTYGLAVQILTDISSNYDSYITIHYERW
jgi:hypothetical protein